MLWLKFRVSLFSNSISFINNNCRQIRWNDFDISENFICKQANLSLLQMSIETIIDEFTEIAHQGIFYMLMGSFGFLSIIILNGIVRSTRKGKRDMNKS